MSEITKHLNAVLGSEKTGLVRFRNSRGVISNGIILRIIEEIPTSKRNIRPYERIVSVYKTNSEAIEVVDSLSFQKNTHFLRVLLLVFDKARKNYRRRWVKFLDVQFTGTKKQKESDNESLQTEILTAIVAESKQELTIPSFEEARRLHGFD